MKDVVLLKGRGGDLDGGGVMDSGEDVTLETFFLHFERLRKKFPPLVALELATSEVLVRATREGQLTTSEALGTDSNGGKTVVFKARAADGAKEVSRSRRLVSPQGERWISERGDADWERRKRAAEHQAAAGRFGFIDSLGQGRLHVLRGNRCGACGATSDAGVVYETTPWDKKAVPGLTVLARALARNGGWIGLQCGCYEKHVLEVHAARELLAGLGMIQKGDN